MGNDEILSACLADDARVGAVAADVLAHLLPHAVEDGGAAGEVNARQLRRVEQDVGDLHRVAGNEVDDARRQSRVFEQAQDVVAAQHRARRGLPDDRVAHLRRRGRQVAADGGEVERRDRVDEAFERTVIHPVLHAVRADRLLGIELLREVGVEAQEVDQLRRRVDFRLERRLRLSEHRRRIQRLPPRRRQQLRGAQKDRRAILPAPSGPLARRSLCRGDRFAHVLLVSRVPIREHVLMVVRHHRLMGASRPNLAWADDHGNVDALAGHRLEPRLQLRALRRTRQVAEVGLVEGWRDAGNAGDGHKGTLRKQ